MSESYPFPIYSGLLEPQHYKKIGTAIWLFLWCVSATTKEVERDGVTWGIVLGNKPLKLNELASQFGVNEKTVRRWLEALEKHDYIKVTRAPHGLILTVKNSKKFKERVDTNVQSRSDTNVQSDSEWTNMSIHDRTEMSTHPDKNVHSNKDIIKINNYTAATTINNNSQDEIDRIAEYFAALKTAQKGRPCHPTARDYSAIKRVVAAGVPIPTTIRLLEQCFIEHGNREPSGAIESFRYCEKYILDRYKALLARNEARKENRRSVEDSGSSQRDGPKYNYGF